MISPITGQEGKANIAIGMLTLVVIGVVIGTISTLIIRHPSSPSSWHSVVSACIGYTYFTMWSVSFYPQVLVNYRRQTTAGLSVDFCLLNVIGFACYSAYNLALFFSSEIQKAYKERHGPDAEITVQSNDVAFAVHALTLSSLTVLQILYYDGFHVTSSRTSKIIGIVIACMLATIALTPILVATTSFLEWLDYLYLLSYIKIVITLIKYVPQVILNYRRKSTEGWSKYNTAQTHWIVGCRLVLTCLVHLLGDLSLTQVYGRFCWTFRAVHSAICNSCWTVPCRTIGRVLQEIWPSLF